MACLLPTYHHLLSIEELSSTSNNTQSWPPLSTPSIFKQLEEHPVKLCKAAAFGFWHPFLTLPFHIAS